MVLVCWVPGYTARVPEQTIRTTAYGLIFFARNRLPVPFRSQRETRVKPESRRSRTAARFTSRSQAPAVPLSRFRPTL